MCVPQAPPDAHAASFNEDKKEFAEDVTDLDQLLRKEREKEKKQATADITESDQVPYTCTVASTPDPGKGTGTP